MLGPAIRALVGVPQRHLNLMAKIADHLSDNLADDRAAFYWQLARTRDVHLEIKQLPYEQWRTFTVGGRSKRNLLTSVVEKYREDQIPGEMVRSRNFRISTESQSFDTIRLKSSDMGFGNLARVDWLHDENVLERWNTTNATRLNGRKIVLLPRESGPFIREQYLDQPSSERMIIASEPLEFRGTAGQLDSRVFRLTSFNGELQLKSMNLRESIVTNEYILFGLA